MESSVTGLEHKFCRLGDGLTVKGGAEIEGYASLFGKADQGGDTVEKGAYAAALKRLAESGRRVKMLWQHDPNLPIGVWDAVREDGKGLYVKGRILTEVEKGREAMALLEAGAIDGLSIGYRTIRARKGEQGQRVLAELELWEVSLVTFPMLPDARVGAQGSAGVAAKADDRQGADVLLREVAAALTQARADLARS